MIKAPLDEKNISPSQIIDDLTCCNNIGKGNTAVGYMYDTPVLFEYADNIMRIRFRRDADYNRQMSEIRKYFNDVAEKTEHIYIKMWSYNYKCVELRFFWQEEEDNE